METLHAGCKTSLWQQRVEQLSDHVFDKETLQRFLGALRWTSVEKCAKFWTYLPMLVRHFKERFCQCWAWSEETDWQLVELIRNNLPCVVWGCCFNSLILVCPTVLDFHTVSLSANFVNVFLAGDTQHQPSRLDHRFICSAKKINQSRSRNKSHFCSEMFASSVKTLMLNGLFVLLLFFKSFPHKKLQCVQVFTLGVSPRGTLWCYNNYCVLLFL